MSFCDLHVPFVIFTNMQLLVMHNFHLVAI